MKEIRLKAIDNTKKQKNSSETGTRKPEKKISVGFGINDCPVWLYRWFTQDVKSHYNDVYWTKLLDVMRKAEAYDQLSMLGLVPQQQEEKKENEDVKEEVTTFTGKVE